MDVHRPAEQRVSGSTFDGNIVIFENRPFGITDTTNRAPNTSPAAFQTYQVDGETVVEAIWGYGTNIVPRRRPPGYAASADRAVLCGGTLLARPGGQGGRLDRRRDLRAQALTVRTGFRAFRNTHAAPRRLSGPSAAFKTRSTTVNGTTCRRSGASGIGCKRSRRRQPDGSLANPGRWSFTSIARLQARTPVTRPAARRPLNAALICPYVVNVIPQTIFTIE